MKAKKAKQLMNMNIEMQIFPKSGHLSLEYNFILIISVKEGR